MSNTFIDIIKVDDLEKERRVEICKKCKHLSRINVCKKCGCVIYLKVWLKKASCPISKW